MLENPHRKRDPGFDKRIRDVAALLVFALFILAARLWFLQIVRGPDYYAQAEDNRRHPQRLAAQRGVVYGRDKRVVLADNRPACDLVLIPAQCEDAEAVCERLERIIGIDGDALLKKVRANSIQPWTQIEVKKDVAQSILTRVEEHAFLLRGVFPVARPHRRYPQGKTAGQILGYLGEIGPEELEEKRPHYHMGDVIGRSGVEQYYEEDLHGRDGLLLVTAYAYGTPQLRTDAYGKPYIEKDSYGRRIHEEYRRDATPGEAVHLTLDIGLQALAERLLFGEKGAIAVLQADTGEVLALASSPGFDPNVFVTRGCDQERLEALESSAKPMRNRCFQEAYAPGSVFKVLLALAALEEGFIDETTSFHCPGYFQLEPGGRRWHCWKRHGHGNVSLVDALAFSCDVFFYNVGLRLGVDRISTWAERFGLGQLTGIDLPGEVEALIPSREWKKQTFAALYPDEPWEWRWYPGDTVNLSIGQGAAATTPLQNAALMAAVLNGGRRVRPYLNPERGPCLSEPLVSERTLALVRRGMRKCVEKGPPAPTGTGHAAYLPDIAVLGKTGSAQIVGLKHHEEYEEEEDIPYELRDHAWFIAGVPDREPPIAVCVLVEHGHHGSSTAAPLARRIIEAFYKDLPESLMVASSEGGAP